MRHVGTRGAPNDIASQKQLLAGFKNLIINGAFTENQRGYVSAAATSGANQYTLDRWRVVTSGQNLTFSASGNGNQITAPAGGVEQVIEGSSIRGGNYVAHWTGTATLTVDGTSRAKGEVFTLTANTNATVRLIGGTASEFQLEAGETPTPFEVLPRAITLILCKRYYYRWGYGGSLGSGPRGFGYGVASVYEGLTFQHSVEMRAAPTITKVGTWDVTNCSQPSVSQATTQSFNIFVQVTANGSFDYYPGAAGRYIEFNSEL